MRSSLENSNRRGFLQKKGEEGGLVIEEKLVTLVEIKECSDCRSNQLITYNENGAIVCKDCGLVITAETVVQNPKSNCSSKPRQSMKSLSTYTAQSREHSQLTNEEICEKSATLEDSAYTLDQTKASIVQKLGKVIKIYDQTDKNIAFFLSEITRLGIELSLSRLVLEKAASLCKQIVEKKLGKGRSIRELCAAAVYAACRQCGCMRTLDEIAKYSKMNKKVISHHYRILLKELNCPLPPANLSRHVPRFLNQLAVEGRTAEIVYKILEATEELRFKSGKNPVGIVSAAIYVASKLAGEKITQREISDMTSVTETSIRSRCRDLEKHLSFLITL